MKEYRARKNFVIPRKSGNATAIKKGEPVVFMPADNKLKKELLEKKYVEAYIPTPPNTGIKHVSDFLRMKPDHRFIVKDFLSPGSATMVYGAPGCMKSLLSLGIATAVSTGKEILGMKTTKGVVLYLDAENGKETVRSRIAEIRSGFKIRSKKYPLFYAMYGGRFDEAEYREDIFSFIKKQKVSLVVIDTFRSFFSGEENSSAEVSSFFRDVLNPLREDGICVLLLHHSTKPGTTYRGSSDVAGKVDSFFSMTKKNGGTFIIKCEKARGAEPAQVGGEILFEDGSITFESRTPESVTEQDRETLKRDGEAIRDIFEEPDEEFKFSEIVEKLEENGHTLTISTLKRRLGWMVKQKFLERPSKGTYKRMWE